MTRSQILELPNAPVLNSGYRSFSLFCSELAQRLKAEIPLSFQNLCEFVMNPGIIHFLEAGAPPCFYTYKHKSGFRRRRVPLSHPPAGFPKVVLSKGFTGACFLVLSMHKNDRAGMRNN